MSRAPRRPLAALARAAGDRLGAWVHPREGALDRFADGALARDEHARVAAHLARCPRCRARVAFARDVARAAGRLPVPAPSPDLLERVLAARAAGARVILPAEPPAGRGHRAPAAAVRRRVGVAGTALAAAAATVLAVRVRQPAHAPARSAAHTAAGVGRDTLRGDVPGGDAYRSGAGLFASVAVAQTSPGTPLPAAIRPRAERVRPLRAEYEQRIVAADGRARADGSGALEVAAVEMDGFDTWRVGSAWRYRDRVAAETAYVARSDLRLHARVAHVAPYLRYRFITVRQRMWGDTVVGWMHTDRGFGRPIRRYLPPAARPYAPDVLAPVLLTAVPLDTAWAGSLSLLGWAVVDGDVFSRLGLRVTGAERVTVPAGTFDCWRLAVTAGGRTVTHWVRKSDGLGVKVHEPRAGGGAREVVLTRG